MEKLKPNIIKLSGRKLSEEEHAKAWKQYEETGWVGTISEKEYIETVKQNIDHIISYENDEMSLSEYCEKLLNGDFDE